MTQKIDTDTIKESVNLIALAEARTELKRKTPTEHSGPCPLCGGDDRFNVQPTRFLCRHCHPKWGDAIEFVQWLEGATFQDACARLEGNVVTTTQHRRQAPTPKPAAPVRRDWDNADWQSAARADIDLACDRLWNAPDGQAGRDYLASRGIRWDSLIAFDLGYGPAWNGKRKAELPAIWLPWQNRRITAIQFRFAGLDIEHGERFGQRKGGDRILFGAHLLGRNPAPATTLILCEGEMNAISIWQQAYGRYPFDVLSWGPEDNAERLEVLQAVRALAKPYRRLIVWADKQERATSAKKAMGASMALFSRDDQDANDLLRAGKLGDLLEQLTAQA